MKSQATGGARNRAGMSCPGKGGSTSELSLATTITGGKGILISMVSTTSATKFKVKNETATAGANSGETSLGAVLQQQSSFFDITEEK
jgi:hypothetical protein